MKNIHIAPIMKIGKNNQRGNSKFKRYLIHFDTGCSYTFVIGKMKSKLK